MINAVVLDNEIKLWWEYISLKKGERFQIEIDGKAVATTTKSHYNATGLTPEKRYAFRVCLGEKEVGACTVQTLPEKKKIDITKPPYNGVGDGKTVNTNAIQEALNACKADECVYFPDGVYLTGALDMPSNAELYLADGATLQGTANVEDYLPKVKSRFEGTEWLCYRSLINVGQMDGKAGCTTENITLRGGKILGGGQALRRNIISTERTAILKEHGLEKEINPPGFYASVLPGRARGRTLCCSNTKNITVVNTFIGDSPSWNLQFIYCETVLTAGSTIYSHGISNGDGWDPDSSVDCVLFDVYFDTGDDCVAIKSGKNLEGYQIGRPSKRIRVFDCYSKEGHGIAIGSEMSGGIEDVKIWNCDIQSGTGVNIKSSPKRGGYIRDIGVYNCKIPMLQVVAYLGNEDGEGAPTPPEISNLHFEDLTLNGILIYTGDAGRREPELAFSINGYEGNPVRDVVLKNITLNYRPLLPNQAFRLNNVENVKIKNITCKGEI